MTKFSNKFKKHYFWPTFGASFFFSQKFWLCHEEKANDPMPRNFPGRRTEEWKDGSRDRQTRTHRTLPATARGPKEVQLFQQCKHT